MHSPFQNPGAILRNVDVGAFASPKDPAGSRPTSCCPPFRQSCQSRHSSPTVEECRQRRRQHKREDHLPSHPLQQEQGRQGPLQQGQEQGRQEQEWQQLLGHEQQEPEQERWRPWHQMQEEQKRQKPMQEQQQA